MNIIAIDPGNTESAYVVWDGINLHKFNKVANYKIYDIMACFLGDYVMVMEQVACMGMPVGEDVFETVFWSGKFCHEWDCKGMEYYRIKRSVIKMHLCQSMRAKDSNIVTALVDRFDPERKFGKYGKGTKKNPEFFYGFSKDIWQAFALAVTWYDQNQSESVPKRNTKGEK